MITKDLIEAGKIISAHKLKGELKILTTVEFSIKWKTIKSLFIGNSINDAMPYFLEECKEVETDVALVKLEDILTIEMAKKLQGQKVFLAKKHLKSNAPNELSSLVGFQLIDAKLIQNTFLKGIVEMPHQLLFEFIYNDKEILLPANESIIIKIDAKKKQIHLNIPDGLLEVYLE
jgi:16S rRNA processing protein RimM